MEEAEVATKMWEKRKKIQRDKRKMKSGSSTFRKKKTKSQFGFKKHLKLEAKLGMGFVTQNNESTSNECTVCFSEYKDDLSPDGV